jgi:hypothetical protein
MSHQALFQERKSSQQVVVVNRQRSAIRPLGAGAASLPPRAQGEKAGLERNFSRVPASAAAARPERAKSPAGSASADEEVTQSPPDGGSAGAGGAAPAPAPAPVAPGGGSGAATKKAELKSGPTYSPSGTIKAKTEGGIKKAVFDLSAEFKHDPANNIDASLGEIRQYIRWTKDPPPRNDGFKPAADYSANTWYEDRDSAGKRYGHRSGTHAECVDINHYEDSAAKFDCAAGAVYKGHDEPKGATSRTGEWQFELKAIDRGNGDKQIGTTATVNVAWD